MAAAPRAAATPAALRAAIAPLPSLLEPLLGCDCPEHQSGDGAPKNGGGDGSGGRNAAPKARADSFTTDESTAFNLDVLANDSDRNGDTLTITHVAGVAIAVGQSIALASGATVTLQEDMTLLYDPGVSWQSLGWNEIGLESFDYTISDGRGGRSSNTVSLTINGIGTDVANAAPAARDDTARTDENTAVTGSVLGNDSDADGDILTVLAVNGDTSAVGRSLTLTSGATVLLRADGTYSYNPNGAFDSLRAGQTATDSFTYRVADGQGGQATATVRVTVDGVDDTPPPSDPSDPPPIVLDLLGSDSQRWNAGQPVGTAVTVTYTFLEATPDYYSSTHWAWNDFRAFTDAQRTVTKQALADISGYANITFVETDLSQAAMTFGIANIPNYGGYAYYPSGDGVMRLAGDVWLSSPYIGSTFTKGAWNYMALIHEIGHAIGLTHPGALTGIEDTRQYTVMSYNKHTTTTGEPRTHMLYDVAAVQHLYGANTDTNTGDDIYGFAALNNRTLTIWDAGGIDTIDVSAALLDTKIDLRAGHFSTVANTGRTNNFAIAYGTEIENATGGAGNDLLISNNLANVLTGGAGLDTFRFHAGWGDDVVADFTRGQDVMDLSATALRFEDLTLVFEPDHVRVAAADDSITLLGVTALDLNDFLFATVA